MHDQEIEELYTKDSFITKIRRYFRKKIMIKDFILILVFCILLDIVLWFFVSDLIISGLLANYSTIYGSMIQVSGGLLGFVVTGFSIITIASKKKILSEYKKAGLLDELIQMFKVTIYLLGLDTLFFIILLILNDPKNLILFFISFWLIILTTVFLYRCVQVIVKLSKINVGS